MSGLVRFAAIADVHGNRGALEAVLADIEARGIQTLINLGDDLYGPLDPHGTAALLAQTHALRIQGNCDRLLLETDAVDPSSTLGLNRGLLTDDERRCLAAAPKTALLEDILLLPRHALARR